MSELKQIDGFVEKVFFCSPTFSAGKLATDKGLVSFAGKVFAEQGKHLTLKGRWTRHDKYGWQFKVVDVGGSTELDPKGLAHFLACHPDIKGIGPVKAQLIADTFGTDFGDVLTNEPERIAEAGMVSMETVDHLREVWKKHADHVGTLTWLSSFGLTHHQCKTLMEIHGNNVRELLEKDPYQLIEKVEGMGFKRVDAVAQAMGIQKRHEGRIRAGLKDCVKSALAQGHTWTDAGDLIHDANELLAMDELDSKDVITSALKKSLQNKEFTTFPKGKRLLVSKPSIHEMETELAEIFNDHGTNELVEDADYLRTDVCDIAPTLEPEQAEAVVSALINRISLISGGAGSGKTFTINVLVKMIKDLGRTVALTAPTGKASQRMTEMIGLPAKTIHRLLEYDGVEFRVGPDNPIYADWVIVDEVSMVDVALAWRLFQAIDLDRTSVVLVGDHNQLEPVGPGNLLRDLIHAKSFPKVILKTCKRQAGLLRENSLAILDGKVPPTPESNDSDELHPWYVIGGFPDSAKCRDYLEKLYREVLSERFGFDLAADVQVASPTHKGPLGTREINIALQRLVHQKCHGQTIPKVPENRRPPIYKWDKVIMTKNNYDLDVMNGTIGSVLQDNPEYIIDFEGKEVTLARNSPILSDIELAYCLTIHKLQGSETKCVIVICHKKHAFQLNRNLLYTGVTRAKQVAFILGDAYGIDQAAKKQTTHVRRTHLSLMVS
ncbi:AAA family ATPase [Sulfidibacter corallicola]|uniref:AAA family ATPase n=1 Tax=Sulfidibacter corallicola TaxID=2818388 RepID=A0A8A4TI75_SULCO|nr:AAA family ATPase [Sulfidibacter corallicola]QTD49626.1 AAA family ATPase [Sulfidibacter corallicola]